MTIRVNGREHGREHGRVNGRGFSTNRLVRCRRDKPLVEGGVCSGAISDRNHSPTLCV